MAKSRMYTSRRQQVRSCSTCYCFVIVNFDSLAQTPLSLSLCNRISICLSFGWMGRGSFLSNRKISFQKTWEQLGRRRSPRQRHSDTLGPSGAKVIAPSQGPVYCASQKIPEKVQRTKKMYILNKHKERKEIHENFSSSSQKTRLVSFRFFSI